MALELSDLRFRIGAAFNDMFLRRVRAKKKTKTIAGNVLSF